MPREKLTGSDDIDKNYAIYEEYMVGQKFKMVDFGWIGGAEYGLTFHSEDYELVIINTLWGDIMMWELRDR
jgi:hypothetical protein